MSWTEDEAINVLKSVFPGMSVAVQDGEIDYLVGTIEAAEDLILASFRLLLDANGKDVTEIRIIEGQGYCGFGACKAEDEPVRHVTPIQVTRREQNGMVWGIVGDYEVCLHGDMIHRGNILTSGA